MPTVNVVVLEPIPDDALAQIARIDPRVRVIDARGWFVMPSNACPRPTHPASERHCFTTLLPGSTASTLLE
jgi:hypothetical protein